MSELSTTYDPKEIEAEISQQWHAGGYFHAQPDDRTQRFVVVIPPPNVTGALHLGHALNNTLQDVLVRWHRMRGFNTLWVPGTDHAGIATQAVVEKRLFQEEDKTRHDVGRDGLVKRIWEWKDQYEARIISQLKTMGCSCDFERNRFTLDDGCSRAVRDTFYKLFEDGYIFKGKRLVNWDCELQTAVADDEVYHENIKGKFYHFRYPISDGSGHLTIATTRPETMLGDTAVAVNPNDGRYQVLIGKTVTLPLMNREIPIIADEWADPDKGSGCVKITPAHDPNDYEVGLRHNLPMINVLNPDGTINDNGGAYAGMNRFKAREAVVADLDAQGLVDKIEDHVHDVGHSDRSKSPIEPYLSDQWFLRMVELADPTLAAVNNGDVQFYPDRYKQSYLDWLGEKRDWCISRQLWWGHRIPVWSTSPYSGTRAQRTDAPAEQRSQDNNGWRDHNLDSTHVGRTILIKDTLGRAELDRQQDLICFREEPTGSDIKCLQSWGFHPDEDVLDTWFSSALWPHSTLGWPERTADLAYYYPTTVLITSRDIITLWVVRMVLTGLYNLDQKPFDHVYIHPKILDGRGVTMSKSKGNGVDPLDIIEAFGADALRFGIAAMTTETQDIRMPVSYRCPHCEQLTPQTEKNMFDKQHMPSQQVSCKHCKKSFATRWADESVQAEQGLGLMVSDKFEVSRNFMNKLWNAARFAFMNLDDTPPAAIDIGTLPTEDRWILAALSSVTRDVHDALSRYQFSRASTALRNFFWDALCDWYLELIKYRFNENHEPAAARQVLAVCLDQVLRLMHPIIPFITERLWKQLNEVALQRGLPGAVDLGDTGTMLAVAAYPPSGYDVLDDHEALDVFHDLQAATRAIREGRNTAGLSPKARVNVTLRAPAERLSHLEKEQHILVRMAGIDTLVLSDKAERPAQSAVAIVGDMHIFIHDCVDDQAEHTRVSKRLAELEKRMRGAQGKLSNEGYLKSAPPEVVAETRQILETLQQEHAVLTQISDMLGQS